MPAARTPQPRAPQGLHAFNPDPDVPADFHRRRFCADCGKPGADGDPQHPYGALPAVRLRYPEPPPGAAEIDARILGEDWHAEH
jgi:hypothetical protein